MWKNLYEEGAVGSEGGRILADEEYRDGCRITLEKCRDYCAITCGVYGSMVHTAFTDFEHGREQYDAMKRELQEFMDADISSEEDTLFYEQLTHKY